MTPTHANKRGRRYRYYISASFLGRGSIGPNTMRVPAGEVEGLVLDQIQQHLASPQSLAAAMAPLELSTSNLEQLLGSAKALARRWPTMPAENQRELIRKIVSEVKLSVDEITVSIRLVTLAKELGLSIPFTVDNEPLLILPIAAKLRRAGKGKRMIIGDAYDTTIDPSLVRLLQEAHAVRDAVLADTKETLNELTASRNKSKGYLTSLMRISYLSPQIIDDILNGRQPPELSAKRLLRTSSTLPLDWDAQRAHLQFS